MVDLSASNCSFKNMGKIGIKRKKAKNIKKLPANMMIKFLLQSTSSESLFFITEFTILLHKIEHTKV